MKKSLLSDKTNNYLENLQDKELLDIDKYKVSVSRTIDELKICIFKDNNLFFEINNKLDCRGTIIEKEEIFHHLNKKIINKVGNNDSLMFSDPSCIITDNKVIQLKDGMDDFEFILKDNKFFSENEHIFYNINSDKIQFMFKKKLYDINMENSDIEGQIKDIITNYNNTVEKFMDKLIEDIKKSFNDLDVCDDELKESCRSEVNININRVFEIYLRSHYQSIFRDTFNINMIKQSYEELISFNSKKGQIQQELTDLNECLENYADYNENMKIKHEEYENELSEEIKILQKRLKEKYGIVD